jgi:hypothetical protein
MNDIRHEILLLEDIKKSLDKYYKLTGCMLTKYENHVNKRIGELNAIPIKPSKSKRRRLRKRLRESRIIIV